MEVDQIWEIIPLNDAIDVLNTSPSAITTARIL